MKHIEGVASSDLTNEEWRTIQPLLPRPKKTGRPRADDRSILNAIFYVLHTGCQWKEIPRERYGPYSTAANRLRIWQSAGIWQRVQSSLLLLLLRKQKINLTTCYLDGSLITSKRGDAPLAEFTVDAD
jgi:transposase